MDHHGKNHRVIEVAKRLDLGENVGALAEEYQVNRATIWRWGNEGRAQLLPDIEDRDTWRTEIVATLTDRLTRAIENNDDKTIVKVTEGLRKMLGLDHADMVNEAWVRIEARKLDLLARALEVAADRAKLDIDTRIILGHALDEALAELEASSMKDAS